MSRPIRYQPEEWSVSFVTGRCIHSRYLLRPSPRTNAIVIGALARALKRYEVKLFGVCFMSNHYHLLLSSKNAAALASFMQYIGSNIARKIGRMHRWREKCLDATGFDGQAYDDPAMSWTQSSYVQPQMHPFDRLFYNDTAGAYTVPAWLADLDKRYGGIDAALVWPTCKSLSRFVCAPLPPS